MCICICVNCLIKVEHIMEFGANVQMLVIEVPN